MHTDWEDSQDTFLQDLFCFRSSHWWLFKSRLERWNDSVVLSGLLPLTNMKGNNENGKSVKGSCKQKCLWCCASCTLAKSTRKSPSQGWNLICTSVTILCCLCRPLSQDTWLLLLLLELLPSVGTFFQCCICLNRCFVLMNTKGWYPLVSNQPSTIYIRQFFNITLYLRTRHTNNTAIILMSCLISCCVL